MMDTVIDPCIWPILSSIFSYNQIELSFPINAISMDHLSPLDPLCINCYEGISHINDSIF